MSFAFHIPLLRAALVVVVFLIAGVSETAAGANQTGAGASFEKHPVEFHNRGVNLAGSLLLPKSEVPVPAVIFIHGAGPQTREPYREVGEYFARQGIAALIYERRAPEQSRL